MEENKNIEFSQEEVDKITQMVIELKDNSNGIELKYQGDLLAITKENKPYKLSNEELIALKIFLDTLSLSIETLNSRKDGK